MAAGEKYRPSNGTEGECFYNAWCARCVKDEAYRKSPDEADGCEILVLATCLRIDEPAYPKAWVYGPDGQPICTSFTDKHPPTEADRKYLEWKASRSLSSSTDDEIRATQPPAVEI